MTWGIDVSNHQAGANLAAAKAAGCAFVFVKATEGLTYTDSAYSSFRAKAASLSLPLGAYHFARPQPGRSGADEARKFLSVHTQRAGDLPPVLDLEDTKLSPSATVAFALDWLNTVQRAAGVRPLVYTYTAFARANLAGGSALAPFPLWLADYRSSTTNAPAAPAPWSSWAIWQHTSTAKVPGVPGNCDRNITNLTPARLVALGNTQEDDMFTDQDRELLGYISKQVKATAQLVVDYSNVPDAQLDTIAARVVSKLPGSIDGALVKQAVKEALKEGTS